MSERKIEWVSQADLERITGKDRRTISGRIKDLHFKQEGRSKLYDKMLAVQAIVAKSVDPESDAKNRRALAEAEKAELLVARLKGELVPVSDMKRRRLNSSRRLYARTVRVTPRIVAPQMMGKTDVLSRSRASSGTLLPTCSTNSRQCLITSSPSTPDEERSRRTPD
jgi:hypothetical protein